MISLNHTKFITYDKWHNTFHFLESTLNTTRSKLYDRQYTMRPTIHSKLSNKADVRFYPKLQFVRLASKQKQNNEQRYHESSRAIHFKEFHTAFQAAGRKNDGQQDVPVRRLPPQRWEMRHFSAAFIRKRIRKRTFQAYSVTDQAKARFCVFHAFRENLLSVEYSKPFILY